MKIKDLSLIVVSCDAYTDLGKIFFDLQSKYMGWFDENRFFVNETVEFSVPGVNTIHVGKNVEWNQKVSIALSKIKTKYVLFMLEDYFIGEKVNEKVMIKAMDIIKKHNLKYYRITPSPKIRGTSKYSQHLVDIPQNVRYGINLQAAIFRKDFLEEISAGDGKNAWQIENDLNKNVDEKSKKVFEGCVADPRSIIDIHNGVIKGKWVPKTIKYFDSIGYKIDIGDRPFMSIKDIARMRIIGTLSHVVPKKMVRKVKYIARKVGIKFVTD